MTVESAVYINTLNAGLPPSNDPKSEGDDHLRLIKSVLKATFPNLTGPVTLTQDKINSIPTVVPMGTICMFLGLTAPVGWTLCDGSTVPRSDGQGNITSPDLRDRFIVGAGRNYAFGVQGGVDTYNLSVAQLPPHNHAGVTDNQGNHAHGTAENPHQHVVNDVVTNQGGSNLVGASSANPNTRVGTTSSPATTGLGIVANGIHAHNVSTNNTGSGAIIENRPPFYAVTFIMKI